MDVDVVKLLSSSVILFSSSPLIWVLEATSRLCHRTTVEGFRRPEDQIKGQIKPSSVDLSSVKKRGVRVASLEGHRCTTLKTGEEYGFYSGPPGSRAFWIGQKIPHPL